MIIEIRIHIIMIIIVRIIIIIIVITIRIGWRGETGKEGRGGEREHGTVGAHRRAGRQNHGQATDLLGTSDTVTTNTVERLGEYC